jgi:2-methylcitrate dehydratase PrpD
MLDAFGCAAEGWRIDPHPRFVDDELGVEGDVAVWFDGRRSDPAHAALVNGAIAHHAELDDGNPRAGLHGGVTVIPAAVAVAESSGASGLELIDAIAFGYAAAIAYGRPLLERIEEHRLHPPAMVGCFGAAAAAGRLWGLSEATSAGAISLAGTLMPIAPFESFTRGAAVKDLYGGYAAYVGVRAAELAQNGIVGPRALFASVPLDPNEVANVYIKPWPSCRSTHAALTALEKLLPFERPVASIDVETYRFAAELTADADPTTPIGAKTSIPHAVAALVKQPIADRVRVTTSPRTGRYARVTVRFEDGSESSAQTSEPRSETDPRRKFRELAGARAHAIERAVDALPQADDVSELVAALAPPAPRAETP